MNRRGSVYFVVGIALTALFLVFALEESSDPISMAQALPLAASGNLPPIVTVDYTLVTVDEGELALNSGLASDPDGVVVKVEAAPVGAVTINSDGTWDWVFRAGDGPDSQLVTVTATDDSGQTSSVAFELMVINVSPLVGAIYGPSSPVSVNDPFIDFSVFFTDPGVLDPHIGVFFWGDGSTCNTATDSDCTLIQRIGGGSVDGSHTYDDPGIYTVQLTVTDDDGGTGVSSSDPIVVYDPEGGFVTGGGWFESPPGAYTPDPSLAGRATFGFVSKYKKGASSPTGETNFQFKVADLHFHSDAYEWLVVNQGGTNAQYKGSGTINGELGPNSEVYRFMLWAKDLGPGEDDTFRIRIWYEDPDTGGESVVYDNGFDQPIGEGNVVIHK